MMNVKYPKVFKINLFIRMESLILIFNIVDKGNSFEKGKLSFDFEIIVCLCLKAAVQAV